MKFRSQVFTAVSGSIGGITYSHNRGGMYTRGRATPTNPNTVAQQAARNAMSSLATAWTQALTVVQRAAWEQYAENTPLTDAFGETITLTGQQMYLRCNSPRVRSGAARVDNGPSTFGQADLSPLSTSYSDPILDLSYDDTDVWANAVGGLLIVQTSQMVNQTINYLKGPFRFSGNVTGAASPPVPPEIMTSNAFGLDFTNYLGTRVFLRVRASDADGRLSPVQILTQDIA